MGVLKLFGAAFSVILSLSLLAGAVYAVVKTLQHFQIL